MFSISIFLIIGFGQAFGSLPLPNSSSDPLVVKHLEKMWEGYHKAVLFRKEQLPAMEYRDQAIVFNDRTFEDHIIDFDAILVFFHGTGCIQCKDFMGEYLDTAGELLMWEPHISTGLMDCSGDGVRTCNKLRIPRLPWLKLFKQGQDDRDYGQAKKKSSIMKFMRNFFGSPAKKLRSDEQVQDYLAEEEGSVLAFFDRSNSEMKSVYNEVAKELRSLDFYFGYVTDSVLREKYSQYDNKIVYIRAKLLNSIHEERVSIYQKQNSLEATSLQSWLIKQQQGLMSFRHSGNEYLFPSPLAVIYFPVILDWDNAAQATINTLGIRESLMAVAKKFSEKMNFAISNKRDYKYELQHCGHDQKKIDSQEPIVCIFKEEDRFRMKTSFGNDAFSEFIENVLESRQARYLKSEPVPSNTGKDVIDVVSTTMDELVFRSKRDVFILFYKPDCGHCQDLMPVWERLGAALRTEQVDVARMNLRDNEIPPEFKEEMFVKEYPTMFLKVSLWLLMMNNLSHRAAAQ